MKHVFIDFERLRKLLQHRLDECRDPARIAAVGDDDDEFIAAKPVHSAGFARDALIERGVDAAKIVCIRSGLGAGMVSNGRLHWGAHHSAGELGRWRCPSISAVTAPYFYSGQQGGPELQDIASARSIQKALQKAIVMGKATTLRVLAYPPTLEDVLQAAQQKDALTLEVVGRAANELGSALGNLALAVDPSKFILAGQLTQLGETFLNPVREAVTRTLRPSGLRVPEIVNSIMGEYIGALGAAALALHEWKPERARRAPEA